MENNNEITLNGVVVSAPEFSHELYGESFFTIMVETKRLSGISDTLPVLYSERAKGAKDVEVGAYISIIGSIRTRNDRSGERSKLKINVFADEITVSNVGTNDNYVLIHGFICKNSGVRKTPKGREITDLLIAVNRDYGKSDYIPCICWGRNSSFVSNLPTGTELDIVGRLQSRTYVKKYEDDTSEEKVAYELSISKFEEKQEER